ncbi:MAG: hypothetical protein EON58_16495, partial [Alphaproteobacteria bacterium]
MTLPSPEEFASSEPTTALHARDIVIPKKTALIIPYPSATASTGAKSIVVPSSEKGGQGGSREVVATPSTSLRPSNSEFLAVLFDEMPETARPMVTSKPGDPQNGAWLASDATKVDAICPPERNTYLNCASFRRTEDGLVARLDNAAA